MPIDAVLFDVDDTLCRYRRSAAELLSLAFDDVGVEPFFSVEAYHRRYSEFMPETDGVADLRRECFAAIAEESGFERDVGYAVADAFAAERDHRDVEPLPGALEAVESLGEDHAVGVVTNGDPGMQSQKLEGLGLADAFEVVVHAGYDTAAKPDPEPFERALSVLDVSPERAVHVGNSLSSDVAGAHNAGVGSVWLDQGTAPDPVPHYTLGSMRELRRPPWLTESES
ncbi:HAD family hydrolase [Halorarius litoreus]|uniref:HAD family hydrolase n=1 Tax=Halorarius litoreus TaxID=2962676 RepID=UPI0020CEB1C3|nr:HAD family hydrolase [Halorarius litoreus]